MSVLPRKGVRTKPLSRGIIADLFAGGGGASTGIEAATGLPVDVAVNHWELALDVHKANHPNTRHYVRDVFAPEVHPRLAAQNKPVDLLWASPDCTQFSSAKGGKPRNQKIRGLANVVIDWAREVRPKLICVENVREFLDWGPLDEFDKPIQQRKGEDFDMWRGKLELLGYQVEWRILVACDYGAPTSRKRLVIIARCDGRPIIWPAKTHGPETSQPWRGAAECIDWSIPAPSIFGRKRPLAAATLWRLAEGIRRHVIQNPEPYIVGGNAHFMVTRGFGERPGQAARVQDIRQPLTTLMAQGTKQGLCTAFLAKHYGGVIGLPMTVPFGTITAKDHHGLVTAEIGDPERAAEVRAFLACYYGNDAAGQPLRNPMRTITTKDRFALVTVAGVELAITDIGHRMIEPHEALRGQFGEFAEGYDLSAATKTEKTRLVGNSVCPHMAQAVVRANYPSTQLRTAA